MSEYYDRDGSPMTREQWLHDFSRQEKKRVAFDTVTEGVEVSTVWLGLNHAYGEGPPLIFETLVFGGLPDGEMDRYSTETEAIAGHAAMVERVKASAGVQP